MEHLSQIEAAMIRSQIEAAMIRDIMETQRSLAATRYWKTARGTSPRSRKSGVNGKRRPHTNPVEGVEWTDHAWRLFFEVMERNICSDLVESIICSDLAKKANIFKLSSGEDCGLVLCCSQESG